MVVAMALFNIFGKKDVSSELTRNFPYRLFTEWIPYKLYSNKNNSCTLNVKIKNLTKETLLTSIVAELPDPLGFDQTGISKQREVRIGEVAPGDEREVGIEVFGNVNSDPGEYTVTLTAIAHYRDYGHIINAVKKRTSLQVV
jgi:uncharacterized membrane protein